MVKVLVFYYFIYGYIEMMVNVVVDGVCSVGVIVDVKCVFEMVLEEIVCNVYFKFDQVVFVVIVVDFEYYDVIIVGIGMCFGCMLLQLVVFFDQVGGLWVRGVFNGKIGGVFILIVLQYGGNEMILFLIIINLLYFGMIIVGFDYGYIGQMGYEIVVGGVFYGVMMIVGGQGECQLSEVEFEGVCYQGCCVVEVVMKVFG